MNPIVELSAAHVVHRACGGGVLTSPDLAIAPGETVGVVTTPTHPAGELRTTEAMT